LWQSVSTLAVRGITISGRVVRRRSFSVFDSLSVIDCRRPEVDRTNVGERSWKNVTFVYLSWRIWKSDLTLAVRGNTISGRVALRQSVSVSEGHRVPSTQTRWDIRWVSGRGETWIFLCLA
jgi:hypothetical protein